MLKEFFNKRVQIYDANIKRPIPLRYSTYKDIATFIGMMPEKYIDIFDGIAAAELAGDMKRKQELKAQLYYIVPAVDIVEGTNRKYINIERFTGLMALDFDHIDNADKFRDYLLEEYDFVIATWLSASKRGIKALVSIPVVDSVDEFKQLFWGLANNVMLKYKGFDTATQNSVLPLFLSPDADIKLAREWRNWTIKGENPKQKKINPTQKVMKYDTNNISRYQQWCVNNITKAIGKIVDNGHPQLRAASYLLGGYVATGYFTTFEAESLINSLINNNAYLSQKPSVYIKTASEMIVKGQSQPVSL